MIQSLFDACYSTKTDEWWLLLLIWLLTDWEAELSLLIEHDQLHNDQ